LLELLPAIDPPHVNLTTDDQPKQQELDEPGIKAEWYMDEMHLDAAGNQAIAQIIANKIVADGLLR
jgi:lysophospholipase L1-like esterase